MKNNLEVLIKETQSDLDMLEYIGLKGSPHWNSVIVGMKRLRDFEAELRQMIEDRWRHHYGEADWGGIALLKEILGEEGGGKK